MLDVGDITLPLLPSFRAPASGAGGETVRAALQDQRVVPMQDLLIRHAGGVTLVDAGLYDIAADSPYHLPGYAPPASIDVQMRALGVQPTEVRHVVITHRHFDHFTATTRRQGEAWVPTFPNAEYLLGAADWAFVAGRLGDSSSREARTFGVLHAAGRLEQLSGARRISAELSIFPAPGETPGHQAVRLHSDGETFYALGDLYHHPVEVSHPEWMVNWADQASNVASRAQLVSAAVEERAVAMASHVRGLGRIVADGTGARWEPVE